MSPADWRALIEAYLDGRLSAEAFMRRFIEGWTLGAPLPRAVTELQLAVEAFEAEVRAAGEDGVVDDDALRQAAARARANLDEGAAAGPYTFDRTRAREDLRRFEVRVQRLASIGCVIALAWFALCMLQIYFVSEWIQKTFEWGAWPSALLGFVLAFTPVIGNVLAFLGAIGEGWPGWLAALIFFAAPAITFFSGWSRWRRS